MELIVLKSFLILYMKGSKRSHIEGFMVVRIFSSLLILMIVQIVKNSVTVQYPVKWQEVIWHRKTSVSVNAIIVLI